MVRAFVRAALFGSVFLALWTLARPAAAALAPLCDDRGASAVAAPPPLEAPDEAIERARATCPTTHGDLPLGARISPAQKDVPRLWSSQPRAVPAAALRIAPPSGAVREQAIRVALARDGVRSRVERPPRG
jgi:hypothetical protein